MPDDRFAAVLASGGESGALMRSIDWSKTDLGPIEGWSQTLRTMVGLLLCNRFPMLLWWGPRFVQIYNDAYVPIPGAKHPDAMGQAARDCWAEIWHIIGPMVETPYRGGPATTADDLELMIRRHGFLEETHFKVAYSPVPDESLEAPGIGGVLATVAETTQQVFGERQLRTLGKLGAHTAEAKTAEEACRIAHATLAESSKDLPFVLFYLTDEGGRKAQLACSTTFAGWTTQGAPQEIDLDGELEGSSWPLAQIVDGGASVLIDRLGERFGPLPKGAWQAPPNVAVAMPLSSPDQARPYGVMICGTSPHRSLDSGYRTFLELAAAQVVTAIRNARAYETEKKRAEALAEIDRAKTAFFSNVSHEFRTPLTLMLGPTEDLLAGTHGELSDEQRDQLQLIRRNELRLQRLVNALLDFSRIEAGRATATYEPSDLAALTRDVTSTFRSLIERAGLRLEVDIQTIDEPVFVDRALFEHIVLNLISNAFKFTFDGSIEVSLRRKGHGVELVVSDTGVGIAPEHMGRLFERFHRVEGTRARTYEGSGIGLALVRELARLHGGDVRAESKPGAGTSFFVTIPFGWAHLPREHVTAPRAGERSRQAPLFVEEAARWLPSSPPGKPANGGGGDSTNAPETRPSVAPSAGRILVADDNADMREYLRKILETRWHVETVENGAAALRAASERRPDIVLTDVMMPGMDGFALLRALRSSPATTSIPVVMLSARAGDESMVGGLNAGADDYLVKPFSAPELLARVSTHLELSRLRALLARQREHLYSLLMQAPVAIAVLRGPRLVYELANPRYVDLVAQRPVVGRAFLDAFPELGGHPVIDRIHRVMETGEPIEDHAMPAPLDRRRDGVADEAFFHFVGAPIRNPEGVIDRVMFVVVDATEEVLARRREKEATDRIAESEMELRRALSIRDAFLSAASHELRTPLTTVQLQADGLVRTLASLEPRNPTLERTLHRAMRLRREAARLEHLLEGTMESFDFRPEALASKATDVDLAAVAEMVVTRARDDVSPDGAIHLTAEPVVGRWDPQRLDFVLSHLVGNAVKYGNAQPVDVVVSSNGEWARVTVSDRGIGISGEDHERIFERYERAVSPSQYAGLGLGLWIVRESVNAMGGSVTVGSDAGSGAKFTIELPRHR